MEDLMYYILDFAAVVIGFILGYKAAKHKLGN